MVFKSLKCIFTAGIIVYSLSVNAAPVTLVPHGNYTSDTVNGLDWLDLIHTSNYSYNNAIAASSSVDGGGWRYATNTEIISLYSQLFPSLAPSVHVVFGTLLPQIDDFTSIFGTSYALTWSQGIYSRGLYEDEAGVLRLAGVENANLINGANSVIYGLSHGSIFESARNTPSDTVGTFLVRPSVVPVPAAVWLFGSGLLGLIAVARLKA